MLRPPKVWSKFSAITKDGTIVNLRIVDVPEYLYEEVINLYINHFVKEESTFIAAGVPNSTEALEELRGPLLKIANKKFHIVICCLDNDDDQIKDVVGASMMALVSKGDPEPEFDIFKTDELKRLFELIHGFEAYYNEMKAFNLDRCFSDRGLFTCPDYRGLGIAQEFFKVRRTICKEHGIPVHGAWMTSYGTQKAAERDGWETVFEIHYEELRKNFGVKFGEDPPTFKFMIARIQ